MTYRHEGKRVVDLTEVVTVPALIEADIVNAVPKDGHNCMMALAGKRMAGVEDIIVGSNVVLIQYVGDDFWHRGFLDHASLRKTEVFDEDPEAVRHAMPFVKGTVFRINPPHKSKRLGYKKGKSGTNVRGTGKNVSLNKRAPRRATLRLERV